MKIGIAREMVTPNVLSKMAGYASRSETFKGIHDDLYVKTFFMKNDDTQVVIISFDIIQFKHILNERIQDYLKQKYGVSEEQVVISYSHTHAGPSVRSQGKTENNGYEEFLLTRTKCCIDKAFLNIFEGDIYYASIEGNWNVNRRRKTKNGIALAPNYEGIKDKELSLLIAKDTKGQIKGIYYNYSCHAVTLGATLFLSSEFPGRVNQLLEAKYYGCITGFLQGAAGNMRPMISARGAKFQPCTFEQVDQMAKSIVSAVENIIDRGAYTKINPVLKASAFIIPAETDAISKEKFKELAANTDNSILKSRYQRTIDNYENTEDTVNIHAGLVKLSKDLYVAYMGGEVCYEVKLLIKNVLKGKKVIFLGYNEAITYIPSAKLIKEGGYEGNRAQMMAGLKGPFKLNIDKTISDCFKKHYEKLG